MRDVVIVDSVRTGLTKAFRGSFNLTRSDDLLAHCIDSVSYTHLTLPTICSV